MLIRHHLPPSSLVLNRAHSKSSGVQTCLTRTSLVYGLEAVQSRPLIVVISLPVPTYYVNGATDTVKGVLSLSTGANLPGWHAIIYCPNLESRYDR